MNAPFDRIGFKYHSQSNRQGADEQEAVSTLKL
jgi:hypothetical protein